MMETDPRAQHNIELLRRAVELGLDNFVEKSDNLDKFQYETSLVPPKDFEINPLLETPINAWLRADYSFLSRGHPYSVASGLVNFLFTYASFEKGSRREDASTPTGILLQISEKIGHGTKSLDELTNALVLPGYESLFTLGKAVKSGSRLSNAACHNLIDGFICQFRSDYTKGLVDIDDERYILCRSLIEECVAFNRRVEQIGLNLINRLIKDPKFDATIHFDTTLLQEYDWFLPHYQRTRRDVRIQRKEFYPQNDGSYREGEFEEINKLNREMPIELLQRESDIIRKGLIPVGYMIEDLVRGYNL